MFRVEGHRYEGNRNTAKLLSLLPKHYLYTGTKSGFRHMPC